MEGQEPLTVGQLDAAIRRLKQQRARAASSSEQRYRALLRESLDLEIASLERQRARVLLSEDQQRGALMRKYLAGPHARAIRGALRHVVAAREAHLFLGPMPSEGSGAPAAVRGARSRSA
jgi:hypothetical protein